MTMPAGSPAPRDLDEALVELLTGTRAQSVRLIDIADGRVLAARAAQPVPVDAAADLALARLAEAAFAAAAADGGFGDLVLAGRGATHVLAPAPYGSVLVVRLARGADVGVARRAAFAPWLAAALQTCHPAAPGSGSGIPLPRQRRVPLRGSDTGPMPQLRAVPAPRAPEPAPSPSERQPALAALAASPFAGRTGKLAARALGDFDVPVQGTRGVDAESVVHVPLPRRSGRVALRADSVLATTWNRDVAVMQRVLDGLRRLA